MAKIVLSNNAAQPPNYPHVGTYSLTAGGSTSDSYYNEVRSFTNEVLASAEQQLGSIVEDFVKLNNGAKNASKLDELYLELLTLGVYWRAYAPMAETTSKLICRALSALGTVRCHGQTSKKMSDWLKGIILTLLVQRSSLSKTFTPTKASLEHLITWLAAIGDFRQEANRLRSWQLYLQTLSDSQYEETVNRILDYVIWFESHSESALGKYTAGVNTYRKGVSAQKRWQEDLLFCSKSRTEYHLNMVGAEILNRVFRPNFMKCARYELLVPGCMRAKRGRECQAQRTELGLHCTGCTTNCRVHQLTRLGIRDGYEVYIASHESEVLAQGGAEKLIQRSIGVVGVACVPNLISGGWKLNSHNIPAQCVLLNCSGCKRHWHESGIPTDISFDEVGRVLPSRTDVKNVG